MMSGCRNLRSQLAAFIAATAVILVVAAPPAGAAAGFGDVEEHTFFTEAVAWMVAEGITSGVEPGCFGPADNVSRGQIAAFLFRFDRASGHDPQATSHPFTDVIATYQQEPVGWLYATKVSTGTSPTTFDPDAPITRGDFAVMLWRYAGRPTGSPGHPFLDVSRGYQQPAISWMAAEKITTGTSPTTFSPEGKMTRAEAATFIWRFAAPIATTRVTEQTECLRPLRIVLERGGLTAPEAACALPFLAGFSTDYLISVATGKAGADTTLILAVVELVNAGCVDDGRIPQLVNLLI